MRRPTWLVTLAAAILLLAGCRATGGGATAEAGDDDGGAVTVEAAQTDAGTSLVGPDGMTLYIFTQDTDGTSTCVDDCAELWPPFEVEAGAELTAGDGVDGELATTDRDDGATQVTYEGMPLYFYAEDAEPGDATGEGVGDVWFIASPEGADAEPSDDSDDDDADASDDASDDADASPSDDSDPYDY